MSQYITSFGSSVPIMKIMTVSTLFALTLLGACSNMLREDDKRELARYLPYTGEPVSQINSYSRFDGWGSVDDNHVVIHTNFNETYLLTIAPACIDLPFATRLGVVSRTPHTISSGFDSIRVGRENCRITEIRPVNYKKMKADLAAEKKLKKEQG